MPGRKEYRGGAGELALGTAMTAGSTSFTVTGDVTNWPAGGTNPFVVDIDSDLGSAEKLLIQSRSGQIFTVVASIGRGYDGTTAQSHAIGAIVRHVLDADTLDDANRHVNDDASDDHSQYLNTTRHDVAARHTVGTVIPAGTPGTSAPGDSASGGASSSVARADHRHGRTDSYGGTGAMTAEAIGDTAAAGTSAALARIDHRHAMPAFGSPSTQAIGDVAADGVAATVARSDHLHAMPAFAVPSGVQTFGGANAAGTAATLARSDHVHALPATLGLTQDVEGNDGDSASIAAGASLTLQTVTKVTTGTRLFIVSGRFQVRGAGGGAFAGFGFLKMGGVNLYDADRRFNSYGFIDADDTLTVEWFTITSQAAGSHTFTLEVTNDAAAPALVCSNRNLNVYTLGG